MAGSIAACHAFEVAAHLHDDDDDDDDGSVAAAPPRRRSVGRSAGAMFRVGEEKAALRCDPEKEREGMEDRGTARPAVTPVQD